MMTFILALVLSSTSAVAFESPSHCVSIESSERIPFTFTRGSVSKHHFKADRADFLPAEDATLPVVFKETHGSNGIIRMSLDPSSGKATGWLKLRYPVVDALKEKSKDGTCIQAISLESNYQIYNDEICAECTRKGQKQARFGKSTMTIHLSDGQSIQFPLFNFD